MVVHLQVEWRPNRNPSEKYICWFLVLIVVYTLNYVCFLNFMWCTTCDWKSAIVVRSSNQIVSEHYVIPYELINVWVLDSNRRVWVWLLPRRWHILSILSIAGRGIIAETCGLDDVCPPDDRCYRPDTVLIYIYLYACILYTSSAIVLFSIGEAAPITVFRTIFGSGPFLCWMPLFAFFGFTNFVLL